MDDADSSFRKLGNLAYRVIAGEGVLVPIRSGISDLSSIFTMNEVGTRIWELIDPRRTSAEICCAICAEFDVAPGEAVRDVAEFVATLCEKGLIAKVERADGCGESP